MHPSLQVQFILFIIVLLFAGLCSFLETSFTALRLFKLKELQIRASQYQTLFATWEQKPQHILITILIANNFAHVLSSVLITEIMQRLLGTGSGLALGVALATVLILIFGEIIPKSLAKGQHERFLGSSLWILNGLLYVLRPLASLLAQLTDFFYPESAHGAKEKQELVTEKEIEFLIDYSDEQGLMEAEKSEMLQNVFELGNTIVNEIIVPKTDMILVNADVSLDQAMRIFAQYRYSRLPVYSGKEDNIIGILYQKDLFALLSKKEKKPLRSLVRPVLFVPSTKKINQLLREFLEKRIHMAIVIDEYGAIDGLVTLEDVIEEIVGDIRDEDEAVQMQIIPLERGGWLVDARMSLEQLEDLLNIDFDVENSLTLAGFLSEKLQHLPRKGERLTYQGYCFQIQQASRRRVFQALVFKQDALQGYTNTD